MKVTLFVFLTLPLTVYSAQESKGVTIKDVIVNMYTGIHFRIHEPMTFNEALSILLAYEAKKISYCIYGSLRRRRP